MELPESTIDDLLERLRRVEGQVRGHPAGEGYDVEEVQRLFLEAA